MINAQDSRAFQFFRRIVSSADPATFLRGMIGQTFATESEFLDFKEALRLDANGLMNDDLQKIWSKALGAFANSDGGVIIWGIKAKGNIGTALSLAPDALALKARLFQLQPNMTEPPVRGVEIEAYQETTNAVSGFVVCFIPASSSKPHQSKKPHNDFLIRVGDNCVSASFSLVKALFAPDRTATLEVMVQLRIIEERDSRSVQLAFFLHNAGPSSAYDVFILYHLPEHHIFPTHSDVWKATESGLPGNAVSAIRPLHPEEKFPIFPTQVVVSDENRQRLFGFRFDVYAKDQAPIKRFLNYTFEDYQSHGTYILEPAYDP